nr:Ycf38 [Erythrocladia irregularis]
MQEDETEFYTRVGKYEAFEQNFDNYYKEFTGEQAISETRILLSRYIVQTYRRSALIIAGLSQPLLWLLVFGGLFEDMTFSKNALVPYLELLGSGMIVFTAFTSSLNAGLPIMFDREFGFFNRLLAAPLASRFSIVISAFFFIVLVTLFEISIIAALTQLKGKISYFFDYTNIFCFILLLLLVSMVTMISILISFIMPGHIELLAFILLTTLPVLFCSSILVPVMYMPDWLAIVVSFNPLTYVVEAIRYTSFHYASPISLCTREIDIGLIHVSLTDIFIFLLFCNYFLFSYSRRFFSRKLD